MKEGKYEAFKQKNYENSLKAKYGSQKHTEVNTILEERTKVKVRFVGRYHLGNREARLKPWDDDHFH